MDDRSFVRILNRALADEDSPLPPPPADAGDVEAIARWSAFLARCVRAGASLDDPRWERTVLASGGSSPRFRLAEAGSSASSDAEPFRVGLALLLGMMPRDPDRDSGA